jgi:hypothetical protein
MHSILRFCTIFQGFFSYNFSSEHFSKPGPHQRV